MWNKISARCCDAVLALGAVALMAGCGSVTPELDARFGDAVRSVREQQTLNPAPAASKDPVQSIDAKAAVNAQERYQDSFKTPPKTFDVLGIGGNLSSGSGQ